MRTSIIFFIFFFCIPAVGITATIIVPDDYPTIQGAIDASVNGDTVLVRPGTYVEDINVGGRAITVTSVQGPDVTIIENGGVSCFSGESKASVLDGFTITNGWGMQNDGSNPTVMNCIFSGNNGGMWNYSSNPTVTNCIFIKNMSMGGAGGMYNLNSSPTVTNCAFIGNLGGGGGIFNWTSSPTVTNCIFTGNSGVGGGMRNVYDSSPTVTNCTFSENEAFWKGGGMSNEKSSNPTVVNCIFWKDTPDEILNENNCFPTVTYCCIQGGYPGTGNIDSDPLFVDPDNGDFHLTFNSPCRGSGDNTAVTELYDFEGDPRITYGTVDMGADEFFTHLYWTGDATPGGNIEIKLVGLPGTSPVFLWVGSGVLGAPIPTMYGDWYLDFPILLSLGLGPIFTPEGVSVLPYTFDPGFPAMDIPMQALIEAELTNLCVMDVK